MKTIIEYLRSFIISPEFVVVLGSVFFLLSEQSRLVVSPSLALNAEAVKYMALLPAGILVWNLSILRKIRFPERDKKNLLQSWDGYSKLRVVLDVALIYSIIFALFGATSWVTPGMFTAKSNFIIQISSFIGAAIVALSCLGAELRINEIFS